MPREMWGYFVFVYGVRPARSNETLFLLLDAMQDTVTRISYDITESALLSAVLARALSSAVACCCTL
jgi:hypothetical protein